MSNNSWLIVLFIFISATCYGQQIVQTNQVTIAWDEVTMLVDNTPIPASDVVSYEVLIKSNDIETSIGVTNELTYTLTFIEESRYIVGVRTIRYLPSEDITQMSAINWSDVNGESTPEPFIIIYIRAPYAPNNLGVQ